MREIFVSFSLITSILLHQAIRPDAKTEDTYISDTAIEACIEYGNKYDICPELLMAIIEKESSGISTAENGSCKGLMQISVNWHYDRMERLGVTDIFDERVNIFVGTDYLAELFERYEDPCYVLDIYNGNANAKYNYENGIVSPYAESVLSRSAELESLHEELIIGGILKCIYTHLHAELYSLCY